MYVCICKAVSDQQLKQAVAEGCASKRALCAKFGVGSQCGRCAPTLREFLTQQGTMLENIISEESQPVTA